MKQWKRSGRMDQDIQFSNDVCSQWDRIRKEISGWILPCSYQR